MAEYKDAFAITMGHEGGYVHDADDAGGETYRGIARRYNPGWAGWTVIDELKNGENFPANLADRPALQDSVLAFYKERYWDPFWGDEISDQNIANELFDTAVNLGIQRAVTFLQQSLNLLNRNQKLYDDLVEDGAFGNKSFGALNRYLEKDDPSYLLKIMNILQGMHYINYMRKSPVQEKYARGWLKRVQFKK